MTGTGLLAGVAVLVTRTVVGDGLLVDGVEAEGGRLDTVAEVVVVFAIVDGDEPLQPATASDRQTTTSPGRQATDRRTGRRADVRSDMITGGA